MHVRQAAEVREDRGYAMVALLILMAVMAIAMTAALPAWSTLSRREKEAELVFRGEQYARAVVLFQRRYQGAFPPNVDVLVNERFLRKKFKDPITNDDFQPIRVGEAIAGPQAANPLTAGRGGAPGQTATTRGAGAGTAGAGGTTGGGAGATLQAGGRSTGTTPQTGGRATFQLGGRGTQPGGAGGFGVVGPTAGIMGVTSKSTDPSLRVYKGGDHYNQWLFIGTQATTQAGGRGAQTPGAGVRGGAPPGGRPTGPGGRAQPPPFTPFGGNNPFGRGPAPAPAPTPAPGGGRR